MRVLESRPRSDTCRRSGNASHPAPPPQIRTCGTASSLSRRAAAGRGISRFPNKVLARMRGVCDCAGSMPASPMRQARCGLRCESTTSAPRTSRTSRLGAWTAQLDTRPARPPVTASPTRSRMCTHDAGPPSLAKPSTHDSFIHHISPALTGAQKTNDVGPCGSASSVSTRATPSPSCPAGTTGARSPVSDASMPGNRIGCRFAWDTNAVRRCVSASDDITRCVVPSRHGVLSWRAARPATSHCKRSCASARGGGAGARHTLGRGVGRLRRAGRFRACWSKLSTRCRARGRHRQRGCCPRSPCTPPTA
jgi:hypothetical protein